MTAPPGMAGVLLALSLLALLGGYPLHWPLVWTAAVGWARATPVAAALVTPGERPAAPPRGALPCRHPVYCYGRLLRTLQLSGLYNDSKTLVDRPLRAPPAVVLRAFAALPPSPDLATLTAFVATYFDAEGSELQTWLPPDWHADPTMLEGIADVELRAFVADLHGRWRQLGRAFNRTGDCAQCYSSFALPGAFIVPGGRFREAYYWDSYWVVDALLLGDMAATARTVLDNFLYMVRTYGFVPNGGRIYYTARSQPPLLTRMVRSYAEATGDMAYAIAAYPLLREEHAFWMRERTVVLPLPDGTNTTLNVYAVPSSVPRPEAYKEDDALAAGRDDAARRALFSELASGAESGWDYSSRWLRDATDLGTLQTRSIVPVDLNSILYDAECWLATLADASEDADAALAYRTLAVRRRHGMHRLMWDEAAALYRDYHWPTGQQTPGFYASAVLPLWADAVDPTLRDEATRTRMLEALAPHLAYPCGVPTSDCTSGQQWDMPNAWPPLQLFMVEGLRRLQLPAAEDAAEALAQRWVQCNYCGWNATGGAEAGRAMFEKYDATQVGAPGGGGEYVVQQGFGWTNGVAIRLAVDYGDRLWLGPCPR